VEDASPLREASHAMEQAAPQPRAVPALRARRPAQLALQAAGAPSAGGSSAAMSADAVSSSGSDADSYVQPHAPQAAARANRV